MRPTSVLEMKVGLLMLVGIAAIVTLVMMTDRIQFDRFYTVKAYMVDAAGLRANSPVTLDGIRVGEVVYLNAVSDPRGNIQVILRINERTKIPSDAKLTIASSGIFGDSFLAFSGASDAKAPLLAQDGSAEVQAARGFFDKASQQAENILSGVSDLLDEQFRNDMKRLMHNAANMAESSNNLVKNVDAQTVTLKETLQSIKELSDTLKTTVVQVDNRLATTLTKVDGLADKTTSQIQVVSQQAEKTLATINQVGAQAGEAVVALTPEISRTLITARQLAERIDRIALALENGEGVAGQLLVNRPLAEDLNHMAIDLSRTASVIADHPEVLVFGMSQEQNAAQQQRREREKQRRAFQEGYHSGIPLTVEPAAVPSRP
jgi:phospholipid/cholesterol/gamma-HCH transport system substrate-binding protein